MDIDMKHRSVTAKLAIGVSSLLLTAWAPTRDYFPPWISLSGVQARQGFFAEKGASITLARFAPRDMVLTTSSVQIEKRNYIPSGTILIKIEENPFTACEITRPRGHESFYCFIDRDQDGSFDGVYHLFSNSYFLLSGWTNRTPKSILPLSYQPEEPSNNRNPINITMDLESIRWTEYKFKVRISSRERQDYWVYLGDLIITPDNVGKEINIFGSVVSVLSFRERGPLLHITPPAIGSVVNFTVPKQMPNGWYSGAATEGGWTEIKIK